MKPDLFFSVLAAALHGPARTKGKIRLVESPQHTKNHFAPISSLAGKDLEVMERNDQGDCMCIEPGGKYLIDVDHRDIAR